MTWKRWFNDETALAITAKYLFYAVLVVFARPENQRSYGLHEPIGPASVRVNQYAASGVIYTKQKYIDPSNYDEGYFDFRCTELGGVRATPNVTAMPELVGEQWYAICGTPFENHAEYVVTIWSFCALGFFAFYNALARSAGGRDRFYKKKSSWKVSKLQGAVNVVGTWYQSWHLCFWKSKSAFATIKNRPIVI